MSILRYIKTDQKPDIELLVANIQLQIPMIQVEQRGENIFYFWLSTSSRGVDLSIENENFIEIRNTICSNFEDYQISDYLLSLLVKLFGGKYLEHHENYEDGSNSPEYVEVEDPFFQTEKAIDQHSKDGQTFVEMLQGGICPIALHGPKRKIHFGTYWLSKLKGDTAFEYGKAVEKTIFKVNNTEPKFEYGNVLETGEGEYKLTMKLISNQVDCILDKYDYICFQKSKDEMILITNDDLNTILPKSWKRLDEYTVIAPILSDEEFSTLIKSAELMNREHELNN